MDESSTNSKSLESKNTDTNNPSSSFQNKSNPNSDTVNQSDDLITDNNKVVVLKNQGKYEEALEYYDKAFGVANLED